MIELPDNHCYLVVRVSENSNGDKTSNIVACFSKLSAANAMASHEIFAAYENHPCRPAKRPQGRLIDGRYYARIEADKPGKETHGGNVEVKVKRVLVRDAMTFGHDPYVEYITSSLEAGPKKHHDSQTEDYEALEVSAIQKDAGLADQILATRRRVESEIEAVPVRSEYHSKFDYYRARDEDINILLSSSDLADTFLGGTLKYHQSKQRALEAVPSFSAGQVSLDTFESSMANQRRRSSTRPTEADIDELIAEANPVSPTEESKANQLSPISPLSMGKPELSEVQDEIEKLFNSSGTLDGFNGISAMQKSSESSPAFSSKVDARRTASPKIKSSSPTPRTGRVTKSKAKRPSFSTSSNRIAQFATSWDPSKSSMLSPSLQHEEIHSPRPSSSKNSMDNFLIKKEEDVSEEPQTSDSQKFPAWKERQVFVALAESQAPIKVEEQDHEENRQHRYPLRPTSFAKTNLMSPLVKYKAQQSDNTGHITTGPKYSSRTQPLLSRISWSQTSTSPLRDTDKHHYHIRGSAVSTDSSAVHTPQKRRGSRRGSYIREKRNSVDLSEPTPAIRRAKRKNEIRQIRRAAMLERARVVAKYGANCFQPCSTS